MTWTKDLINSLDVFNVSTNLNLTNQHFVKMTKKVQTDLGKLNLLQNVTLPEMKEVIDHLDIFNVTKLDIFNVTNFDIVNATRKTVADIEQQFNDNPLVAHLKTLSQNSTKIKIKDKNGSDSEEESDENTTDSPPNFLMERIKDLQSFQTGIGSSLKNLLSPMDYLKNSPVKVKDLQMAMRIIPTLMPYVLEANTPKLKAFLKVGTRFTLNELFQIHNSLKDLHNFVAKMRDGFVNEKASTLIKMTDLIIEKNVHLMRTVLVLMVRADRSDKNVLLSQEDINELQEYLVSPSDIYSILIPRL
jgi:hypothetical protein